MGIVNRTVYDSTVQATSHPIALPEAGAGNRLVLVAAGPANLSLSAGDLTAGWAVLASSPINFGELILAELPAAAGGEDSVTVNLNGPRAINAIVYERDDLAELLDADAIRVPGATSPFTSAEVETGDTLALALFAFAGFRTDLVESASNWTNGVVEDYDHVVDPSSNDSTWLAVGWGSFEAAGGKTTQVTTQASSSLDGEYSAAGAWLAAEEPPPPPSGGGSLGGRRRLVRPFAFAGRWGS